MNTKRLRVLASVIETQGEGSKKATERAALISQAAQTIDDLRAQVTEQARAYDVRVVELEAANAALREEIDGGAVNLDGAIELLKGSKAKVAKEALALLGEG